MDLCKKMRWLTLVSSILLVTYNTVGEAIAGVAGFKDSLKDQIEIILPIMSDEWVHRNDNLYDVIGPGRDDLSGRCGERIC